VTDEELVDLAGKTWSAMASVVGQEMEGGKGLPGLAWREEKKCKSTPYNVESWIRAGRRVYRASTVVRAPHKVVVDAIRDLDNAASWNSTLQESRVIRWLSPTVSLSQQVTVAGAGGLVSPRQFIVVSQAGWKGETFVLAGRGVQLGGIATAPGIVTAEVGEGYQAVIPLSASSCVLEWLLDCSYGGAMPQALVEAVLPTAQLQFLECARALAHNKKK